MEKSDEAGHQGRQATEPTLDAQLTDGHSASDEAGHQGRQATEPTLDARQTDGHSASDEAGHQGRQATEPTLDARQTDGHFALDRTEAGSDPVSVQPSESRLFPVTNWERYEFLGLLGQGGMGAVYKARDRRIGRIVALKFIRGADSDMTARFMQEARAQSSVDHLGICKVYEVGEVEGKPFIAMQFVDGTSLQQAARSMTVLEKVKAIKDTAEAISAAHRIGIIHRDLKPSNIMIERTTAANGSEDGGAGLRPVVMDFGLAREAGEGKGLTESGAVMGTPAYMSPEQARGDVRHLDARTDVYSLGATLYDILSGSPPFVDEIVVNIILKVLQDDVRPLRERLPEIPEDLETIVSKCLNKEPAQRYASAQELADDLGRFLDSRHIVGKRLGLYQRLRRRIQRNPPLAVAGVALLASLMILTSYGIRTRIQSIRKERQAQQQAELARKLGEEITKMEWLLRSSRQLPLHDLGREKKIVRQRMEELQGELKSYGELARGLAHYALGRGHLALHEYPQALVELQESMRQGSDSADVQYALGVVLGKHYEQAMYEARLAGGGDWAQKQLKDIEPKYLAPAIDSLNRARDAKSGTREYLEALIAYYKREYEAAAKYAEAAQERAPWLYEAMKLRGDVHLERALRARDSGKYEEAEKEFSAAVARYTEAGTVGQSDGEIFEGLAEAWVRKMEMDIDRGRPIGSAYEDAVAAGNKITAAEPQSIAGHLKIMFAAQKAMSLVGGGKSSAERVEACLAEAKAVLQRQPENPYAREMAANCYLLAAELAQGRGEDPEPLLRKPMELLEPAVKQNSRFLWGLNDLATAYAVLGMHLHGKGHPQARQTLESSLEYASMAMALDATYLTPLQNSLFIWARLVSMASSDDDLKQMLARTDELYARCMKINDKYQECNVNYLLVYASAAQRRMQGGFDTRAHVARALEMQAQIVKLGGAFLDAEQYAALAHYVEASEKQKQGEDPAGAIKEAEAALKRCFAQADNDALCRTVAAQTEWVKAAREPAGKQRSLALKGAQRKAEEATQSPEKTPDAWQVLAETHLRHAREDGLGAAEREEHVTQGLQSIDKALALNGNHAASLVTQGELLLLRGRSQRDAAARRSAGNAAVQSYERALKLDPFLAAILSPRIVESREIAGKL